MFISLLEGRIKNIDELQGKRYTGREEFWKSPKCRSSVQLRSWVHHAPGVDMSRVSLNSFLWRLHQADMIQK